MNYISDGYARTLNCVVTLKSLSTVLSYSESGLNAFGSYSAITEQQMLELSLTDYNARLGDFVVYLEAKYMSSLTYNAGFTQVNQSRIAVDSCTIQNAVTYAQTWSGYLCAQGVVGYNQTWSDYICAKNLS